MPQAEDYLYTGAAPKGYHVEMMPDLQLRPAGVPKDARGTAIIQNRREWIWKDPETGKLKKKLVKGLEARPAEAEITAKDLGMEEEEKQPEVDDDSVAGFLGRILGEAASSDTAKFLGFPQTKKEPVTQEDSLLNQVLQLGFKPVDAMADFVSNSQIEVQQRFAGVMTKAGLVDLKKVEMTPENVQALRGVNREIMRGMAVEMGVMAIALSTKNPAATSAAQGAANARWMAAMNKLRQLNDMNAVRRLAVSGMVSGGISGGLTAAFGPDMSAQSEEENATDFAIEAGGELATRIALEDSVIALLPAGARNSARAMLKSAKVDNVVDLVKRVGGYAVGAQLAGLDPREDFLTWGLNVGIPGILSVARVGAANRMIDLNASVNRDAVDPRVPGNTGPQAAAYRISEKMEEIKTYLSQQDVLSTVELNRLQNADHGLVISKAAFTRQAKWERDLFRNTAHARRATEFSKVGEAQYRAMFPNELNEDNIAEMAWGIDWIVRENTNEIKRKVLNARKKGIKLDPSQVQGILPKGLSEDILEFGGLKDLNKLSPDKRAAEVARRWTTLSERMDQAFSDPTGRKLKGFVDFVEELENAAVTTGQVDSLFSTIERLKDSVITKGILGAAFEEGAAAGASGRADDIGQVVFNGQKMLNYVKDKKIRTQLDRLFGAESAQSIEDVAQLMAYQSGPRVEDIPNIVSRGVNFINARLMFHIMTGGITMTQGSKIGDMLGLTGLAMGANKLNEYMVSSSRFLKVGIENPKKMRKLIDAVYDGDISIQQRYLRELFRNPNEETAPDQEEPEELWDMFK